MKQDQKETLVSLFIITRIRYCSLICSKKSNKKVNAVHERSLNPLMIEVYSPNIMGDISKLRKDMYNLRNFHIFQTENP